MRLEAPLLLMPLIGLLRLGVWKIAWKQTSQRLLPNSWLWAALSQLRATSNVLQSIVTSYKHKIKQPKQNLRIKNMYLHTEHTKATCMSWH